MSKFKFLLALIFTLSFSAAMAQDIDTTKIQPNNYPGGYSWITGQFKNLFLPKDDTLGKTPFKGRVIFKNSNGKLYYGNGVAWVEAGGGSTGGLWLNSDGADSAAIADYLFRRTEVPLTADYNNKGDYSNLNNVSDWGTYRGAVDPSTNETFGNIGDVFINTGDDNEFCVVIAITGDNYIEDWSYVNHGEWNPQNEQGDYYKNYVIEYQGKEFVVINTNNFNGYAPIFNSNAYLELQSNIPNVGYIRISSSDAARWNSIPLSWSFSGDGLNIYNNNSGGVGIGVSNPYKKFQVAGAIRLGSIGSSAIETDENLISFGDLENTSNGDVFKLNKNLGTAIFSNPNNNTKVGININDPSVPLEVVGPVKLNFNGTGSYLNINSGSSIIGYAGSTPIKSLVGGNISSSYMQSFNATTQKDIVIDPDNIRFLKSLLSGPSGKGELKFVIPTGNTVSPVSVNGNFADVNGNISISTGGSGGSGTTVTWLGTDYNIGNGGAVTLPTPTLQQITAAGHTTSYNLQVDGLTALNQVKGHTIEAVADDNNSYSTLTVDGIGGKLELAGKTSNRLAWYSYNDIIFSLDGNGSDRITLKGPATTGLSFGPGRTLILPNANGVLPASVTINGSNYTADDNGNINLGTVSGGSAGGTVTNTSVVSANGISGTVSNPTTTPAITLTTTVTGIVKGNGTALSAASSGSDYAPGTSGNATGIVKSTTGTGALTTAVAADFPTLNQNTTGTASNITGLLNATSHPALTGDVTAMAGTVATTISNGVVTNSKLANMAANSIKGNNTGSSATATDLTGTQATAMLDAFTSTAKGVVPASGGGTTNFLRADGTFAVPPGATAGTVTSVSVTTANGVSGTVTANTTTPSISLSLGAITPTSVAATGTIAGFNLSGSNTGDETNPTLKSKLGAASSYNSGYLSTANWNTFYNKKVIISSDPNLEAYGSSYTAGYVASTYATYGAVALVANKFGKTLVNRGSAGAADQWINFLLNNNLGTTTTRSLLYEPGINGLRSGGTNQKSLEKMKATVTQSIAAWWNATGYPGNSSTITKTGTWVTDAAPTGYTRAVKYSGLAVMSTVSGSTATLSFTGPAVSIGTFVTDGVNRFSGSFDYYVDGIKLGTYNTQGKTDGITDGNNNAQIVNSAIIVNNLSNATHTVSITTLTNDTVHLDFMSVMKLPTNAPAIVISNLPKLPPVSSGTSNADYLSMVEAWNDSLRSIVDNLSGYPITIADQYNNANNFFADNLHYNDAGHRQWAAAISNQILPDYLNSNGTGIISNTGNAKFIDFWNAGASVGYFDYNGNVRLGSTTNLSLVIGSSNTLLASGGGVNSSFTVGYTLTMGRRNGLSAATSTATQSGSNGAAFENGLWDGSVASTSWHGFRSYASTTVNGASRLAMLVNGTGNQNLNNATEVAALYSNGFFGIKTGTSQAATELDVNGALTLRSIGTTPSPSVGQAVFWFDGTNVKLSKNVSGTVTTTTVF